MIAHLALMVTIWTIRLAKSAVIDARLATMSTLWLVLQAVLLMGAMIVVQDATGVTSLMLPSIAPLHHTLTQAISAEMIAQRTQLVTIMY